MSQSHKQSLQTMKQLIRLNKNSEAGFRIAAVGVTNRGLKALLKSYALQRAQFAAELAAEVEKHGAKPKSSGNILGELHRGWILIKAAMTLGAYATESVVLAEANRGEGYALKQYESALKKELDPEIREIIVRQYETVKHTAVQVNKMKGDENGRLLVRLFDNETDAEKALAALQSAGFDNSHIQKQIFNLTGQYPVQEARHTIRESAVAGGLMGALLGLILGVFSGGGILFIPNLEIALATFLLIVLAALFSGAAIGAFLGAIIGYGSLEDDQILYQRSLEQGQILMQVQTQPARAREASRIMRQINLARA